MINKIYNLSIQIMNSKYRVIFTVFIYCIIYSLFYSDKTLAFCMTNEDIPTSAGSKEHVIGSLQRNVEALLQEREHLQNRNAFLMEENLDLCVDNLRLKTITEEQKVTLDLEIARNVMLETEKQQLKTELKAEKTANVNLVRDLIKTRTKFAEAKKRLSTEDLLELLKTSKENSDIVTNKKRKT